MQPSDRPAFVQRLVIVAELFGKPLSAAVQVLYFEALQDLEIAPVLAALHTSARTCTFMPKPAELRTLVVGDTEIAAERAWLTYKHTARTVGAYASPTFADGAIAVTLLAIFGSWERACAIDLSPELWVAKRREFERVYRVARDQGVHAPRTLPGFCARVNLETGFSDATPPQTERLLGDGSPGERRRLEASDTDRERWRQNVRQAIEARALGDETPTTATPPLEPLATIAARVPIEVPS